MNRRDRRDLEKLGAPGLEGRQVVPEGTPGATAHTVTRDVPVSMIARAGGEVEVVEHDSDPCFGCACCVVWSVQLGKLGEAMHAHYVGLHDTAPDRDPDCLVCQVLAGEAGA